MSLWKIITAILLQDPPPPTFWDANRDTLLVGIISALLGLLLFRPLEALLKKFGQWLERAFESLGIGFQKRYYRHLAEQHQWLKLIGFRKAALERPRLRDVYVSLRLSAVSQDDGPRFNWNQIFTRDSKHLAILGQPGAGKSTLLDYLALVFIGHVNHPLYRQLNRPVPIYVRLRDYGAPKNGGDSLMSLIETPLGLRNVPEGYFERLLRRGRCIVLLDGLDEILNRDLHDRVVSEIQGLVTEYPDNRMIVTCRVAGWYDQLPGFRTYEVQEFNQDDVRRFVGIWYREVLRAQAVNALGPDPKETARQQAEQNALATAIQQADGLWGSLKSNENLLRIAHTPLILSLITLVHYARQTELPKGRARLYERCLEILLEEWDLEDKRLSLHNSPSLKDKLLTLKTIAFHFLLEGILEMDERGLEMLVAPLLPQLSVTITASTLMQNIYQRSGVLVEQAIGRYGFAHRALHDYLAASYIADEELDHILIAHTGEEPWGEVILIAVGLVTHQRAAALIGALLAQGEKDVNSLALASWSLAEDIQVSTDLRDEVKDRLLSQLAQAETAGDFGRLNESLMAADFKAAQNWMKTALKGQDPVLRQRILRFVPELGKELGAPFVPLLLSLLQDGELPDTQVQVVFALGSLGADLDASGWHKLETMRTHADPNLKSAATWAWCALGRYEELGLVEVPAGEFVMGSDKSKDGDAYDAEFPQHSLYLPTYYIGKIPVTVAEWQDFVTDSGHTPNDSDSLKGARNHPVLYVTWHESLKYAAWQGMSLPSEAEWEKAARGTDGRIYPWGDEWLAGRANTSEFRKEPRGIINRVLKRTIEGKTTPVGQFSPAGDSPYSCVDMAGNVWEWTRSIKNDYPYDPGDGRENLEDNNAPRVVRGGSWYADPRDARCAYRLDSLPATRWDSRGFRVVVFSPF